MRLEWKKNISKILNLARLWNWKKLVEYQAGKVISITLAQNDAISITLFAFAQGEGISTHAASGDAMIYIIDGAAEITIGEEKTNAEKGQVVVMPANIPHGLDAIDNFKMLLIVVRK
ncbi:MAG: Cupin domain protein [Firmicutes bacterium]|nr:Cupin domain protein [Bacillota bacterium]